MILETAIKNFRRHLTGRIIYLVAIALLVMVSYDCLATSMNSDIIQLSQDSLAVNSLEVLFIALLMFSLMVIFYANRFFIHQQRQEIGILIISGLSRAQISWLFFIETFLGEFFAMVSGLILGLITNKLFAMLLLRFMHVGIETDFWFSGLAILQTVLYYLAIFIILGLASSLLITHLRLVSLISKQHEKSVTPQHPRLNLGFAIAGPILSLISCWAVFRLDWMSFINESQLNSSATLNLGLIIVGFFVSSWFIFNNSLPTFFHWLQHTKLAYQRQSIVDLATTGLNFRRHHQSLVLTTVFMTVSVILLGVGTVIYAQSNRSLDEETPIDLAIDQNHRTKVLAEITQAGGSVKELAQVSVKLTFAQMLGPDSHKIMSHSVMPIEFISISSYRRIQVHQKNLIPLNLRKNQAMYISSDFGLHQVSLRKLFKNKIRTSQENQPDLSIVNYSRVYPMGSYLFFEDLLVVPDSFFAQIETLEQRKITGYTVTNMKPDGTFLRKIDKQSYQNKAVRQMKYVPTTEIKQAKLRIYPRRQSESTNFYESNNFYVRGPFQVTLQRALGIIIFVVNLLAILMTFAWASVFSLRQLSEIDEDRFDFITLQKLGVDRQSLLKSINRQNRRIFLTPVVLGMINGLIIMRFVGIHFDHLSLGFIYLSTAIIFGIYLAFYIFTAYSYRRILKLTAISEQHLS